MILAILIITINSFDSLKIEIVLPLASFMGLISEQNISDASSKNEMQNHHVKHMSKIHLIAYNRFSDTVAL